MAEARKHIPEATEAALWALSNGQCYAPGCTAPVVCEVRAGVYRKNAQLAHIHGVKGLRHDPSMTSWEQVHAFSNLLLLCLPHHGEVDDKKTGEKLYPAETLRSWKTRHEGKGGPALAALGALDEDRLTELLISVFDPPVIRLQKIADQLEQTGELNERTVAELRQVIAVMASTPAGPDLHTAQLLVQAADMFSVIDLQRSAMALVQAADILPHYAGDLKDTSMRLVEAAGIISSSADRFR